jgi:hypothetical protein
MSHKNDHETRRPITFRQAIGIIVSLALAYNGAIGAENVVKTPDYPLFAVSIERSYTRAELDKIAIWFAANARDYSDKL